MLTKEKDEYDQAFILMKVKGILFENERGGVIPSKDFLKDFTQYCLEIDDEEYIDLAIIKGLVKWLQPIDENTLHYCRMILDTMMKHALKIVEDAGG